MYLQTTVGPTEEPVDLLLAKSQVRELSGEEDRLIVGLIAAARAQVEAFLRRRLITQTVVAHGDGFCDLECLPVGPVQSVTSVTYRALDDSLQTVNSSVYRTILNRQPPSIIPKWGSVWPVAQPGPDNVQVTMVVGYGSAADVPSEFCTAILLLVGHLYANREAVTDVALSELPFGVASMLKPHVFWV